MATSETYDFGSPQNEQIITDAYERIGIVPDLLTAQKIQTANRSINFILQAWVNKGLNLWTVQQGMLSLNPNQTAYLLPNHAIDILEATIRTSTRNLGGTAATSAGGTAQNAFDNNLTTACTQTAPNGNISYNWGTSLYSISMVGIQSFVALSYTLIFEYSFDNVTWTRVGNVPLQLYPQLEILWFSIDVPVPANYFRVRETGGATLNVAELYFNSNLNDTVITRSSRAEYIAYPNKAQTGRPSSFYVNRQIEPIVYLWPTPDPQYNNMYYTFTKQIQDIGSLTDTAEIPARFLEALTAMLAFKLSIKENIDINKVGLLKQLADEEYVIAGQEDRERVPLRVYGDYMQGWSQK